jgi:hypothetical protein
MKVYQCIRAYDLYIPAFESKYGIKENNYSFNELRDLLINDGFASTYILKPAFDNNEKDFFFTLWNYKTLQYKWAEENGLKVTNLDEIRMAQVEEFKPDVYYNFSPHRDNSATQEILKKKDLIKICWDAVITNRPSFHEYYDLRLSLFEPYIKFWEQHGFKSALLPPAFSPLSENLSQDKKDIDILFYGQYSEHFFSDRNSLLIELVKWSQIKGYKFELHLQFPNKKRPLINFPVIRRYLHWLPAAPSNISENALPPIYGRHLYETIARSKIVVNAFTNYNGLFKDNMRNYEATSCGAFLISEDGIYPEHFSPNSGFYVYNSQSDLFNKIEKVLTLPDQGFSIAQKTRERLKPIYSKENQWLKFIEAIQSL